MKLWKSLGSGEVDQVPPKTCGKLICELQRGPAAAGVAVEEAAGGLGVHAVFLLEHGDELGGEGGAPGAVVYGVGELVGALRAGFIEHDPDHGRHGACVHAAADHGGLDEVVFQAAAEAVGVVDGGIVLRWVLLVVRGQDDPGFDGGWVSGEAGEQRAEHLLLLDHAGLYLLVSFGDGLGAHRVVGGVTIERERGFGAAGCPFGQSDHGGDPVGWRAAGVVVGVVGVEDGLDFVVAGGESGECVGIGDGVGVEIHGGAGREVMDFLGGDGGLAGTELLDVDLFVAGALLEEDEQASADWAGSGVGQLYTEEYVGRCGRLCGGENVRRPRGDLR